MRVVSADQIYHIRSNRDFGYKKNQHLIVLINKWLLGPNVKTMVLKAIFLKINDGKDIDPLEEFCRNIMLHNSHESISIESRKGSGACCFFFCHTPCESCETIMITKGSLHL